MAATPVSARRPLRIALMLESDGPGGAEIMLLHLAEELRRRGHGILPVGPAVGSGWLAARFRDRGFEPATFHLRSPIDWRCWRGLVSLLRAERIDVVHSHEFSMAVYGSAAAHSLTLPHIITMHGGRYYADHWRRRAALRWAIRRSAALVAVSASTAKDLRHTLRLPEHAVRVIANGIPFVDGKPETSGRGLERMDTARRMLSVGNLYPVKGHDVLLRAFAMVANEDAALPWHVAIAGRGECESSLRALSEELGIVSRVQLLGFRSDVQDLLSASDMFVLPSRSEGLPLALIEAMGASLPIIASRVGGIPEAVTPGVEAILTPPGDPAALADALLVLMRDPIRRAGLGEAARLRAVHTYSVETMGERYEQLYVAAAAIAPRHL